MAGVLLAATHGSEYLVHKYWSRKPANVVSHFVQANTKPGDLVLDPFCGSGVTLIEAQKLGRAAVGFDVNPAAVLVSSVSTSTHDFLAMRRAWLELIEEWSPLCREAFAGPQSQNVKHCVHTAVLRCPECRKTTQADQCVKRGNRYACPFCRAALNTSIAHAQGTAVVAVQTDEGELVSERRVIRDQTRAAAKCYCDQDTASRFNHALLHNTRILAYPGMMVSSLFTTRNFSLLSRFASLLHDKEMAHGVRDALLLVFTSAVASCSRLIPFRGNMEGGGPAWTVPGFWVPPVHLERNPLTHLAARFAKVEKGLAQLARSKARPSVQVVLGAADLEIDKMIARGLKASYIFADPPYGDSVPFIEFSQLWNCWDTRRAPILDREVVVSDRVEAKSDWQVFSVRLAEVIRKCRDVLSEDGRLTITFNSLDLKAWRALLDGLQHARFACVDVTYQLPAVVSAKASFAPTSSYLGDVYATFTKADSAYKYQRWDVVESRLREAERMRGGAVGRVTQLRVAALSILSENVDSQCLLELDRHFSELPARTPQIPPSAELFGAISTKLRRVLKPGRVVREPELCAAVVGSVPSWLGLDQHEIVDVAQRAGFVRTKEGWQQADTQKQLF